MNCYIFKLNEGLTQNYHSGGGAVAVANSLDEARRAIRELTKEAPYGGELPTYADGILTAEPIKVLFDVHEYGDAPQAWLFPNAGCC